MLKSKKLTALTWLEKPGITTPSDALIFPGTQLFWRNTHAVRNECYRVVADNAAKQSNIYIMLECYTEGKAGSGHVPDRSPRRAGINTDATVSPMPHVRI